MAERILVNGKFEVYTGGAAVKKTIKPEIKKAIDSDDKKEESISEEKTVETSMVKLSGDETVKELKLMLKDRNISFAKNAGKEKCLELIAPFLVALDVEDDL